MVQVVLTRALVVVLLMLVCSIANAQTCNGNLPAGTVCGNPTGSPAPGRPMPSSTVLSVATPAVLAAATIPTPIQVVYVTSMSGTQPVTAAQSNCGLLFRRGTSSPGGLYGEILNGGIYWEPVYSTSPVKTCEFGAIGDNSTDATPNIQAAIDYALQNSFSTVCINDGGYKTTDTIQLGYGTGIIPQVPINFVSCANGRGTFSDLPQGVLIRPTKTDRCVFNFQGALTSAMRDIGIIGANKPYVQGGTPSTPPWATTEAGWFDPSLTPTSASFTGTISTSNVLTFPSATGTVAIGQVVTGVGVIPGTIIASGSGLSWTVSLPSSGTYAGGAVGPVSMTSQSSGGRTQYTPYAAVCVDAYSGNTRSDFLAYISGTTMTVTNNFAEAPVPGWGTIWPGQSILNGNTYIGTIISGPPAGGVGTYVVTPSQTVGSVGTPVQLSSLGPPLQPSLYPPVTYPSWVMNSGPSQYYKDYSSDIEFTNLTCEGFAVCFNVHPGNTSSDGNGDFMKFDKIECRFNDYCISISQDQSRLVKLQDILGSRNYTLITNNTFGQQAGTLQPTVCRGLHADGYQMFKIGSLGNQGWFRCGAIYAEGLVRIGTFTGGTTVDASVELEDCIINIYDDAVTGVVAAALLEVLGSGASIELRNCSINGIGRIATLIHANGNRNPILVNGGIWGGGQNIQTGVFTDPGLTQAAGFSGGIFLGDPYIGQITPNASRNIVSWENSTLTLFTQMFSYPTWFANIQYSQSTIGLNDYDGNRMNFVSPPITANPENFSAISGNVTTAGAITSCDAMTFGWNTSAQLPASQYLNIVIGDILYHEPTGTLFVVTAISGGGPYTITTRQMNNMNVAVNGTHACTLNNLLSPPATSGAFPSIGTNNMWIVHTKVNLPGRIYWGDFIKGSALVSNLVNPIGGNTGAPGYYNVADRLWASLPVVLSGAATAGLNYPIAPGTVISSMASNTMTLSQPSLLTGTFPILPLQPIGFGNVTTVFPPSTIANLPTGGGATGTCTAAMQGLRGTVTNGTTSPTYLGALGTPGTTVANVICNGTAWVYG